MTQITFVIMAYAVSVPAIIALVGISLHAMRRAEAALKQDDRTPL